MQEIVLGMPSSNPLNFVYLWGAELGPGVECIGEMPFWWESVRMLSD